MTGRSRAQSEVIGAILLVAVVVIAVTAFGVFYLGNQSDDGRDPAAEFNASASTTSVNITHLGGDSLARADLVVIVRNSSTEREFSVENGTLTDGDTDDQFEPGEEWGSTNISLPAGESVRVFVVHDSSNKLLYDGTKRVSS